MRTGQPIGSILPGERFGGLGRGIGRGLNVTEAPRGRGTRAAFGRQQSSGR